MISLSDEKEARRKAQDIAKRLLKGEGAVLKLTNEDQMVYVRASRLAKSVGLPLDVVALHFAESVKILGGDRVIEAAKDFARRHAMNVAPKRVQEVYDELVGDARARKLSERYIEDLEYRCGSFAAACQGNIGEVTGETVRAFLTEKELGPRSHNNFVRSIKRLFEFAKERKYLPKDHDELDGIGFVKDVGGEIEIFTPDEMVRLLSAAPEHVRVVIAIGGFAGLRSAEIERLDWSEVNLKEGFIKVIAGKGKTASRRIVPISESLAGWLKPSAKEGGPVWPLGHAYFYEAMREAARRTKTKTEKAVEWKHNGLRHSFISYRLAETQNVNQVALEAGNSPQMIFQHYRELVTAKEAARWLGLNRCPYGRPLRWRMRHRRRRKGPRADRKCTLMARLCRRDREQKII